MAEAPRWKLEYGRLFQGFRLASKNTSRGEVPLVQAPLGRGQGGGRALRSTGQVDLPRGPPLALIFIRNEETLKHTPIFQFSVAEPLPPLFFLRRANLEAVLSSGEGNSSPSPLHHPSMFPPSMCE